MMERGSWMKHTRYYQENYPRPQFVRKDWISLDGAWDFVFDDENRGILEKYYEKFPSGMKIKVPFSYQTKASMIADAGEHPYIWYAKKVEFDGKALHGKKLLLNFEGCDYFAKVWVNGEYVGSHIGGYARFTFDITPQALSKEELFIVVRAEDHKDATQPRGKQTWMKNPFGCWYRETNGIWKSVWMETVSEVHLESAKMTPNIENYFVEFESVLNEFQEGYSLRTEVSFGEHGIADVTVKLNRKITNFKIDITNDFDPFRVHFWTPENPQLYDVKFTLYKEEEPVDVVGSYFGFRSFRAEKDVLVLNNNPIYLRMVLHQGYYPESGLSAPNAEALINDIQLAKDLGFNGIRMHQKIEDQRFYYYADIMGMLVWLEMPSPYEFKDATIDKIVPEWMSVVKQFYNHPSIVCWVPINESWGVPRVVFDSSNQKLTEALYNLTKAYDKFRPVISNDGWEHTTSDILTFHNYTQSPEKLESFYRNIDEMMAGGNRADYTQTRLPFARGYGAKGEPIVVSEFAGIGYENGSYAGWGYGDKVSSTEAFLERLDGLVKALRGNDRISGFCITQLTDVESEINGLFDIERKPKADIDKLRKIISQ